MATDPQPLPRRPPLRRSHTLHIVLHRSETKDWQSEYNAMITFDGTVHISEKFGIECPAAHAKDFNPTSVGVAFEGDFAKGDQAIHKTPTKAQWQSGLALCQHLCFKYALTPKDVLGHTELGPHGTRYPDKLQLGDFVTGRGDHSCPGRGFDLDEFRRLLSRLMGCQPPTPQPPPTPPQLVT